MTYSSSCFTVFIFWQFAQVIYRNLQSRTEVFSDGQDGCIAHSIHQCSCTVTRSCQQPACVTERQSHHTNCIVQDTDQDGALQCRPSMQQCITWTSIACEICQQMTMNLVQTTQSQDKVWTHLCSLHAGCGKCFQLAASLAVYIQSVPQLQRCP